jgi:hypothetical protein
VKELRRQWLVLSGRLLLTMLNFEWKVFVYNVELWIEECLDNAAF